MEGLKASYGWPFIALILAVSVSCGLVAKQLLRFKGKQLREEKEIVSGSSDKLPAFVSHLPASSCLTRSLPHTRVQVKFADGLRNATLTALPPRWWQEVIEVPILLTAAFSFAKLIIIRCVARV